MKYHPDDLPLLHYEKSLDRKKQIDELVITGNYHVDPETDTIIITELPNQIYPDKYISNVLQPLIDSGELLGCTTKELPPFFNIHLHFGTSQFNDITELNSVDFINKFKLQMTSKKKEYLICFDQNSQLVQ